MRPSISEFYRQESEKARIGDGDRAQTLPLLAAIAARTKRVRIGTDILMPPLYNPVELAQSAALIDVLSRGRLTLGVGVGYHPDYFAHLGVPLKQREGRFEESLEIMNRAWTTVEPFAF